MVSPRIAVELIAAMSREEKVAISAASRTESWVEFSAPTWSGLSAAICTVVIAASCCVERPATLAEASTPI